MATTHVLIVISVKVTLFRGLCGWPESRGRGEKKGKGRQFNSGPFLFWLVLNRWQDPQYTQPHNSNVKQTHLLRWKAPLKASRIQLIVLPIYESSPVRRWLGLPLLLHGPESFASVIYDLIATDRVIDWLFWLPLGFVRAPISKLGYRKWN